VGQVAGQACCGTHTFSLMQCCWATLLSFSFINGERKLKYPHGNAELHQRPTLSQLSHTLNLMRCCWTTLHCFSLLSGWR
jgi:hypothetical protein